MANLDTPRGAQPVRKLDGSPYMGETNMYLVPAADATALFVGDFVKPGGTAGAAGTKVNGIEVEGMNTVIQAAAGDTTLIGVVMGFLPDQDNLMRKHRLASTNRIALVADAPDLIFEVQEDGEGAALAVGDVGENADIIVAAGNATTGVSAMELDSSTHLAATGQLRIYRLVPRADNALGQFAKWEVFINEHNYKTVAGI